MAAEVWKVFVPCDLFIQPDCFLLGHVSQTNQSVYITASCQNVAEVHSSPLDFLGVWRCRTSLEQNQTINSSSVWTKVWTDINQNVHCSVFIYKSKIPCTCILFNPKDLLQSSVLTHALDPCEFKENNTSSERNSSSSERDNISSLISVLQSTNVSRDLKKPVVIEYFRSHEEGKSILDYVIWFLLWTVASIYLPFRWLSGRRYALSDFLVLLLSASIIPDCCLRFT